MFTPVVAWLLEALAAGLSTHRLATSGLAAAIVEGRLGATFLALAGGRTVAAALEARTVALLAIAAGITVRAPRVARAFGAIGRSRSRLAAFGGRAEDAFDVVIPSLPGYGFSGQPVETGWGSERIGLAWDVLMKRLGYARYFAQGGDWGAGIVQAMGRQAPSGLLGIHTNLPATIPNEVGPALGGGPIPEGLSAEERATVEALRKFLQNGDLAYVKMMNARPQAVGYGLTDSPVGLAGWMLVHPGFEHWSFGRDLNQSPSRDDVLDNFTLYWLTNSATSSARIYWENRSQELISAGSQKTDQISVPVAITVFPEEVYRPPLSWAKRAFRNLVYFHQADQGGHFAAWEYPELFAGELRAAFRSLRNNPTRAAAL